MCVLIVVVVVLSVLIVRLPTWNVCLALCLVLLMWALVVVPRT